MDAALELEENVAVLEDAAVVVVVAVDVVVVAVAVVVAVVLGGMVVLEGVNVQSVGLGLVLVMLDGSEHRFEAGCGVWAQHLVVFERHAREPGVEMVQIETVVEH